MAEHVQCHYDVLGVPQDADLTTIKKHHRKMALRYHPDKNLNDETAAEQFRLVQQAYECLSDPKERKWYDEHRDAILAGWSAGGGGAGDNAMNMLFNVAPFMHPGCYSGYHNQSGGFFAVYQQVFEDIVRCEVQQNEKVIELPTIFGDETTEWSTVLNFYQHWESFGSALNFAWEDKYNTNEDAPNRRVRRLMEEENKKARRTAKRTYNEDVVTLVSFVKRRDPRVKAKQEEMEQKKAEQALQKQKAAAERKREQREAKEAWKEQAQRELEAAEEEDRLAGRIRLADLEDDYDYGGGGKKKRGKGKKKKSKNLFNQQQQQEEDDQKQCTPVNDSVVHDEEGTDDAVGRDDEIDVGENQATSLENKIDDDGVDVPSQKQGGGGNDVLIQENGFGSEEEESEEEEEPDVWRCECCRKDFKSEGQMMNHMKSKKHKEAYRKYQAKLVNKNNDNSITDDQIMADMISQST